MKNVFESGAQKVIPAVLLYAFHNHELLMIHARSKDGLPGKWNGLGGKLDFNESPLQAAIREFQEEACCATTPEQWQWMGQLYFPNFKAQKNEDWWVNVFVTDLSVEQLKQIPLNDPNAPEGFLQLVPVTQILDLDLWEGDSKFLPFVLRRNPFQGTFFYEKGRCTSHEIEAISSANR